MNQNTDARILDIPKFAKVESFCQPNPQLIQFTSCLERRAEATYVCRFTCKTGVGCTTSHWLYIQMYGRWFLGIQTEKLQRSHPGNHNGGLFNSFLLCGLQLGGGIPHTLLKTVMNYNSGHFVI